MPTGSHSQTRHHHQGQDQGNRPVIRPVHFLAHVSNCQIEEVISELDRKKNEALETTWKQVTKDFESIFGTCRVILHFVCGDVDKVPVVLVPDRCHETLRVARPPCRLVVAWHTCQAGTTRGQVRAGGSRGWYPPYPFKLQHSGFEVHVSIIDILLVS